jgi:hypothetical protein
MGFDISVWLFLVCNKSKLNGIKQASYSAVDSVGQKFGQGIAGMAHLLQLVLGVSAEKILMAGTWLMTWLQGHLCLVLLCPLGFKHGMDPMTFGECTYQEVGGKCDYFLNWPPSHTVSPSATFC